MTKFESMCYTLADWGDDMGYRFHDFWENLACWSYDRRNK